MSDNTDGYLADLEARFKTIPASDFINLFLDLGGSWAPNTGRMRGVILTFDNSALAKLIGKEANEAAGITLKWAEKYESVFSDAIGAAANVRAAFVSDITSVCNEALDRIFMYLVSQSNVGGLNTGYEINSEHVMAASKSKMFARAFLEDTVGLNAIKDKLIEDKRYTRRPQKELIEGIYDKVLRLSAVLFHVLSNVFINLYASPYFRMLAPAAKDFIKAKSNIKGVAENNVIPDILSCMGIIGDPNTLLNFQLHWEARLLAFSKPD
jgi:hypothetical protein